MVNQSGPGQNAYTFRAIGRVHSCFKEKFGIPRQPGLVPAARATIEVLPPYDRDEAFRGLEGVSHLWVVFVFHAALREGWRPTVRPPRLGGNQRVGVFATRSNFRPNPVGLSLVRLLGVGREGGRLQLEVAGADLLEGTPVLDLKPYLPYADSATAARAGVYDTPPRAWPVAFEDAAAAQVAALQGRYPELAELIRQVLQYDPRPAYRGAEADAQHYGCRLYDLNIRWYMAADGIRVTALEPVAEEP